MEHAFLSCADASGVDLVDGEVGDVVKLDEVGVSKNIILVFEVILGSGIEGSAYGRSVCELRRSSVLPTSPSVLVKLSHIFITYLHKIFEFPKPSPIFIPIEKSINKSCKISPLFRLT